jgi:hypothetical protein
MVMNTKHHEGFCLFNTNLTNYDAPKQSCGRDLVREYVDVPRYDVAWPLDAVGWASGLSGGGRHANDASRRQPIQLASVQPE